MPTRRNLQHGDLTRRGGAWPTAATTSNSRHNIARPIAPGNLALTKQYLKLLQAIHHSEILAHATSTGLGPPGMIRQVDKLSAFIKPSSPNMETTERVKQNTANWMQQNMTILIEHYDKILALGLGEPQEFDGEAFDRAVTWAKIKYRRKFTPSSADALKAMLQATRTRSSTQAPSRLDPEQFPDLPRVPKSSGPTPYIQRMETPKPQRATPIRHGQRLSSPRLNTPIPLPGHQCQNNQPGKGGVEGEPAPVDSIPGQSAGGTSPSLPIHTSFTLCEETSSGEGAVTLEPQLPGLSPIPSIPSLDVGRRLQVVQTQTLVRPVIPPDISSEQPNRSSLEQNRENLGPNTPVHPIFQVPALSNVAVLLEEEIMVPTSLPEQQPKGPRGVLAPSHRAQVETGGHKMMMDHTKDNSINSELQSESPQEHVVDLPGERGETTRQEPIRHPNTSRKIHDWKLDIEKPIAFIGDSNLARIPPFKHNRIQVDSFPGATFYHLSGVIDKLTPNPKVEMVILAAGLNNGLAKQVPLTSWKQLQQLLKTCTTQFPNATLYVPIINFSDRLDREQQALLRQLNTCIQDKCNYLPALERLQFRTQSQDPVHWTADTAQKLFHQWIEHLNY